MKERLVDSPVLLSVDLPVYEAFVHAGCVFHCVLRGAGEAEVTVPRAHLAPQPLKRALNHRQAGTLRDRSESELEDCLMCEMQALIF